MTFSTPCPRAGSKVITRLAPGLGGSAPAEEARTPGHLRDCLGAGVWGLHHGGCASPSLLSRSPGLAFIMIPYVTREPPLPQHGDSQAACALGALCPPGPAKPREPAPQPLPSGSHPSLEQLPSGLSLQFPSTPSLAPALFRQMGTQLGVPPISAAPGVVPFYPGA